MKWTLWFWVGKIENLFSAVTVFQMELDFSYQKDALFATEILNFNFHIEEISFQNFKNTKNFP